MFPVSVLVAIIAVVWLFGFFVESFLFLALAGVLLLFPARRFSKALLLLLMLG